MTSVRFEDLPPKVRAKVEAAGLPAQNTDSVNPARRGKGRAGISTRHPCPGRCHNCGRKFPTAHQWELHAKAEGHTRWDIDLEAQT